MNAQTNGRFGADKVATACHHPYLSPSLRALGQDLQNPACSPGTAPQFLVGVVEVNYEWDGEKRQRKYFPIKEISKYNYYIENSVYVGKYVRSLILSVKVI